MWCSPSLHHTHTRVTLKLRFSPPRVRQSRTASSDALMTSHSSPAWNGERVRREPWKYLLVTQFRSWCAVNNRQTESERFIWNMRHWEKRWGEVRRSHVCAGGGIVCVSVCFSLSLVTPTARVCSHDSLLVPPTESRLLTLRWETDSHERTLREHPENVCTRDGVTADDVCVRNPAFDVCQSLTAHNLIGYFALSPSVQLR